MMYSFKYESLKQVSGKFAKCMLQKKKKKNFGWK